MAPALDIASVQRKLVRDHRGGYCFEQNRLLSDALRAIGFEVTELAARVLWGQPEDAITARTHTCCCASRPQENHGMPTLASAATHPPARWNALPTSSKPRRTKPSA